MLSKWNYWFQKEYVHISLTWKQIETALFENGIMIHGQIPGGTLSRVYEISSNRVLKTQIQGKTNLFKEYCILKKLYGDIFPVSYHEILIDSEPVAYYIMPKLNLLEESACTPSLIRELVQGYQSKLESLEGIGTLINYSLHELVVQAKTGLQLLKDHGILSEKMYSFCWENCIKLSECRTSVLCHGDLSQKNIMQYGSLPVIIDWEDAMIGPQGYDAAYWLTFMAQRKYYRTNSLHIFSIGKEEMKEYMSVIVTLKSALSLLNQSYKAHSLSCEERMLEIFRM